MRRSEPLVRAQLAFTRPSGYRWNWRFQGIFTSDPRTAESEETAATDGGGNGGNGNPNDSFKFIASRKTFDLETHAWIDFFPLNALTIGPYLAVGASTVMSKNELANEPTTVSDDSATGDTNTTQVVTSAKSDNDIKFYAEAGALSNIYLFNRKVYLQSILAYGRYEALTGLGKSNSTSFFDPGDSRNRFIGKLRVFPMGLHPGFGKQIEAAPMFGVEVNAGRGPDFVKFFVGYAIKIQKISGVPGVQ